MKKEDVKIVNDDVALVLAQSIAEYEELAEKVLQPAHIERSIIQVYAYRELLVRKGINEAFAQTFPQFATGLALDLCGEPMGCYRLADQAARCMIRFTVAGEHDNIKVPKGTQIAASDKVRFITVEDGLIVSAAQYVDVLAVANVTGTAGNGWEAGQVKEIINWDMSVEVSATNIEISAGGIDQELDEDYRRRILLAPEAFTSCGSVAAYDYHARSVSQTIADVAITTPVAGTVKVIVLTKQGLPSTALLKQVQDYLSAEKRRPLCDTVQVVAPTKINYSITATLDLLDSAPSDALIEQQAQAALREYLSRRAFVLGKDIVPLEIMAALKVPGVYNVTLSSPSLREVQPEQWAYCESIRITINHRRRDG